jgi:cytochrome c553
MVKKILKVTGIILGGIVLLIAALYLKVYISTEKKLSKKYDLKVQPIEIRRDSATLALGARLIKVKGCADCHDKDLGGKIFIDDTALGLVPAANLTKGKGGRPADYNEEDWLLALKHGVHRDRTPLVIMPSNEFTWLSENDMSAIIAYATSLPPVDRGLPKKDLGPLAKVLSDLGKLPLIPAEMIDHSRKLVKQVKVEISAQYGKYLATSCQGCHRENMKGGEPIAPGFPQVADISSSGQPGKWTDEQFIQTLRTGVTPEGRTLKAEDMPWQMAKEFTDIELKALHLYLNSL